MKPGTADTYGEQRPSTSIVFNHEHCATCPGPCLDVCPTDASMRLEDGRVIIQRSECTVTRGCHAACPYDVIDVVQAERRTNRAMFGKRERGMTPVDDAIHEAQRPLSHLQEGYV